MPKPGIIRVVAAVLSGLAFSASSTAQSVPFTSGPIPLCATSTFTADVSGIGMLMPPGSFWSASLLGLTINITSDHPQTLQVQLTSPEGTTLLLSAFNGAGGQDYTNTTFAYSGYPSITTGTAPFSGSWTAQGGPLSVFDGEFADGTWTITVTDTACAGGGVGPGGTWTPGWFDGSAGGGGFAFAFEGPPPCWGGLPSGTAYLCPGETVDLSAYYEGQGFGYTYGFQDPDWNPVPDPTAVSAPGTYWIDAMDPWNGCWYTATFSVFASPQAALGPDHVVGRCDNAGPVDLTALFPLNGAMPVWSLNGSPISVAAAAAATTPGDYRLIGQTPGGCNDTAMVTLNALAVPALGPDQAAGICAGESVDLTTFYTTTGLSAIWRFGGVAFATPTAATDAGTYSLIAADASGCADTAAVTLTVQASPALGPDRAIDLCSGASADLTALYATTGSTTAWTLMDAPVTDPTSITAAGTYQLVASNGDGCTDTARVAVHTIAGPELGADASTLTCSGDAVDLTALFTTTGLSTAWTSSGISVPDPTLVSAAGVYTLIATDATGCRDSAEVTVTVAADPVLGPDQEMTACAGMPVDLTALYATGTDATAWTVNGGPVDDPAMVTESGTYTVTATNAAGCSSTAAVVLDLRPAPALGPDQALSICAGSTIDLTGLYTTMDLTSAWTLGGDAVADPAVISTAGTYQLVVVNEAGCTDTVVAIVTVHAGPSLGADRWFSLCPWQAVDLDTAFTVGDGAVSYTFNGAPISGPVVSDSGAYAIMVVDPHGCTGSAMAFVSTGECPCGADFTDDARCRQDPVRFTLLTDQAVLSAWWDLGGAISMDIDPVMRFTAEGDVPITLRATLDCGVVSVERTIHLQDCADSCTIWIPSAFTPDGDTWNDTWTWQSGCEPEEFHVEVHDRFGEVIFTSNDPQRAWDGTYRGIPSPPGVYAYRLGYLMPYQDRKQVAGSITLLR